MPTPIFSKTFIKAAIASGALVPPPGQPERPATRLIALLGWLMALAVAVLVLAAMYWGR